MNKRGKIVPFDGCRHNCFSECTDVASGSTAGPPHQPGLRRPRLQPPTQKCVPLWRELVGEVICRTKSWYITHFPSETQCDCVHQCISLHETWWTLASWKSNWGLGLYLSELFSSTPYVFYYLFIYFKLSPHTCLHWTLASAFAKPSFALVAFASSTGTIVCGSALPFFEPFLPDPLRQSHVTAHSHTEVGIIQPFSPYLTSHMTAFLIPRPSSTPREYKMRVFVWFQTRVLVKGPVVRRPTVIATSLTPGFCWVHGSISHKL